MKQKIILFILIIFYNFPLLAKVCETKDFIECINNNGKIECDKNIYWNIVKDKLWFYGSLDDPPLSQIKLIKTNDAFATCGSMKCQGEVIFSTFDEYKERYYPKNEWAWYNYDKRNERYLIYDHMTYEGKPPRKYLYVRGNKFELTESFELEPPNITINRTSSGVCYD